MAFFTPLRLRFLVDEEIDSDFIAAALLSVNILIVGPPNLRTLIADGLKRAIEGPGVEEILKIKIFHLTSLRQYEEPKEQDENENRKKALINYVIILIPEGTAAMHNARNELKLLDVQYLNKHTVQIVNWRALRKDAIRTPNSDIVNFVSLYNVMVHNIDGEDQMQIDTCCGAFYKHLNAITRHPEIQF